MVPSLIFRRVLHLACTSSAKAVLTSRPGMSGVSSRQMCHAHGETALRGLDIQLRAVALAIQPDENAVGHELSGCEETGAMGGQFPGTAGDLPQLRMKMAPFRASLSCKAMSFLMLQALNRPSLFSRELLERLALRTNKPHFNAAGACWPGYCDRGSPASRQYRPPLLFRSHSTATDT